MNDEKPDNTRSDKLPMSRRAFFRAFLQEVHVVRGALKGKEGYRLADVNDLPDEQLARIKPVISEDYRIFIESGQVWAEYQRKKEDPVKLFAVEDEATLLTFNLFDGRHTLAEIGKQLARKMAWEEERAFAHTRAFFLSLVKRVIGVPKNPL
ncbi:MAG: hypothetical protein PVI59_06550 [Anaerolineae bacterium]|jgi:hypothetical protein